MSSLQQREEDELEGAIVLPPKVKLRAGAKKKFTKKALALRKLLQNRASARQKENPADKKILEEMAQVAYSQQSIFVSRVKNPPIVVEHASSQQSQQPLSP